VEEGALILGVVRGGPAAEAGLQATQSDRSGRITRMGDDIVAIDGLAVKTGDDLFTALAKHQAGDNVTITILRGDERHEIRVELQAAL